MSTMLTIINAALMAQGQEPLIGENDGSLEWRMVSSNWPMIVESELEAGGFHFTKEWVTLLNRTDGSGGFDDAYLVPSGTLHLRDVKKIDGTAEYETDWVQDGRRVHVNASAGIKAERVAAVDPNLWTPLFTNGIRLKIEALILRGLKEEYASARDMEAAAEIVLQDARTSSSRAKSREEFHETGGRFVNARLRRAPSRFTG